MQRTRRQGKGNDKKPNAEYRKKAALAIRTARERSGKGYFFYGSGIKEVTKYFAGINPAQEIAKIFRGNKIKVLELGCGNGRTLKDLEQTPKAEFFGTTLKHESEHPNLSAKIVYCHFGQLVEKFGQGSMDFIFSNGAIAHAADLERDMETITRVLKKGGRLLFNVPLDTREEFEKLEKIMNRNNLNKIEMKTAYVKSENPGIGKYEMPIYVFYMQKV